MKRALMCSVGTLLFVVGILTCKAEASKDDYEVWVIDQSDTASDGGGTLFVYEGSSLARVGDQNYFPSSLIWEPATGTPRKVIDLGGAARNLCLAQTGTAPRRAHMIFFNASYSHAIISFVATGHVLFMETETGNPVSCVDVGDQAHAAYPSPDESYVVVANQNGKLLQRIATNYKTNTFSLDAAATLNLASCVTPNGAPCENTALRPDNAPICPIIDSTGRFTFLTLRGGGLFVVDSTTSPMSIVGEYDRTRVHPNGCGGVEALGRMYINSGGGTAANPLESDVYAFPLRAYSTVPNLPNTPAPTLVFSHDDRGFVDSHGGVVTRQNRYLWFGDRAANRVVVVNAASNAVVNEFSLAGRVSVDPGPDLMDISPNGDTVFVALRGPNPLTANVAGVNNAVGNSPGIGIVRVDENGRRGVLQAVVPISRVVGGVERADPHGLKVRLK